ncbi:hypothetical protein PoB_005516800 [Plakobranchus ocellatus]|uniref:Uncharacterized protein n=1 Tax=Plakobranchus ocellatus TaxID=259542 RepID=A0AAV4CCG8_9GAST|nr:hypothetical protein PoB_005516800 [Plakobranchus ocellatus]
MKNWLTDGDDNDDDYDDVGGGCGGGSGGEGGGGRRTGEDAIIGRENPKPIGVSLVSAASLLLCGFKGFRPGSSTWNPRWLLGDLRINVK